MAFDLQGPKPKMRLGTSHRGAGDLAKKPGNKRGRRASSRGFKVNYRVPDEAPAQKGKKP